MRTRLLALCLVIAACEGSHDSDPDPVCTDGIKNGLEIDVDCGSPCALCAVGRTCRNENDCLSNVCNAKTLKCEPYLCDDGKENGGETDIDCGGPHPRCPSCANGKKCVANAGCASGLCETKTVQGEQHTFCAARPTCNDTITNGDESDVDCGGSCFRRCAEGRTCNQTSDCDGIPCDNGKCFAGTCTDEKRNGVESDIDCGNLAPPCHRCDIGKHCGAMEDCASSSCESETCVAPTCTDHQLNGDESEVDCGGSCETKCAEYSRCHTNADCANNTCLTTLPLPICAPPPTCTDHLKNGSETDVDCGGPGCPKCAQGKLCKVKTDCLSVSCNNICQLQPSCINGVEDGDESDVDCGGSQSSSCAKCLDGKKCLDDSQCMTGYCGRTTRTCEQPLCDDHLQNGLETNVDCSGPCPACATNDSCFLPVDCASWACTGFICREATCADGLADGLEPSIDCGGACPTKCGANAPCFAHTDCASGFCNGTCVANPTCTDGKIDGTETGLDCGGSCTVKCAIGVGCAANGDCTGGGLCVRGRCAATNCGNAMKDGDETDVDCGGSCGPCDDGKTCAADTDCVGATCRNALCLVRPLRIVGSFPADSTVSGRAAGAQLSFSQAVDLRSIVPCVARNTPAKCNVEIADARGRVYTTGVVGLRLDVPSAIVMISDRPLVMLQQLPPGQTWQYTLTVRGGADGPKGVSGATMANDFSARFNVYPN